MAKVDLNKINKAIEERLISVQKHPTADLWIYNYTEKAQYDHVWTPETVMCRGLILDKEGNIIARPFRKFFNLGELDSPYAPQINLNQPFDVYEKMDGSLGILYFLDKKPYIATRGSFTSDQATEANKILQEKYVDFRFDPKLTFLFEIVYPKNRIVINYGKTRDLYLLAVIETATGKELSTPTGGFPTPKYYDYENLEEIKTMMDKKDVTDEGFVIRFQDGERAKIKYDDYVRLHRLITGVTARRIWDLLRNKQTKELKEMTERVPEEFLEWVKDTKKELNKQYGEIYQQAYLLCAGARTLPTRKEQAELVLKMPRLSGACFKMLDNKDVSEVIWKMIKPEAEKPFVNQNEEI
jgi:T4 RnlA family RNA ligase